MAMLIMLNNTFESDLWQKNIYASTEKKKAKSTQTVYYVTNQLSYCFQIDQVVFDKGKLAPHLARFFSVDQYALNNLGRGSPNGH